MGDRRENFRPPGDVTEECCEVSFLQTERQKLGKFQNSEGVFFLISFDFAQYDICWHDLLFAVV